MEEVKHYTINGRYRIVIEQAASTKGVLGFKVEANGDDMESVKEDVGRLLIYAQRITKPVAEEGEAK